MKATVYVSRDSSALSMGAESVASAIHAEAGKRGHDVQIIRNGSRGMVWLEPLVEVVTAQGRVAYGPTDVEKKSLQYRRSLYVVQDLKAGEVLTRQNVRAIRPGLGLPPQYMEQVLGKTLKHDVKRGTAVRWDLW